MARVATRARRRRAGSAPASNSPRLHDQQDPARHLGYTGDVAAYQALVDANSNLIQKPFTVSTLGERVRQVLGR